MLLGKDEDGNAGEQNIERIVVIKNITGRTLRLGVNDRREYREKKPRDTDAVEYDLLFAAEIPTAEIVSADKIDGKAKRKIAVGEHDNGADQSADTRGDKGAEQGKLGQKKGGSTA